MADKRDSNISETEAERRRIIRGRNVALALVLGGFAVLFFFITIAKMS